MFKGKNYKFLKTKFKTDFSEKVFDDIRVSYAYRNNSRLHFHFTKILGGKIKKAGDSA